MTPSDRRFTPVKIGFDTDGPKFGAVRLLRKTTSGFRPRGTADIAELFGHRAPVPFDIERFERALILIARAMNVGDLGLAAIASAQLPFPRLTEADLLNLEQMDRLLKARVDDPDHPGYPKGEPDGKGGQFRPKDADLGQDIGPLRLTGASAVGKAERLDRLKKRRGLRAALRRVLTFKRLLRLFGENAAAAVTEAIPFVDVATDGIALADDVALVSEITDYRLDTEAAVAFVEKGPLSLAELQVSETERSFPSFFEFKKKDEIEKFFGGAGDGMDYHHIVEQSAVGDAISEADVQSTGNIVKIPRLLHEEINSIYATPRHFGERFVTPREYLRGRSFKDRYDFGLKALREVGVLH